MLKQNPIHPVGWLWLGVVLAMIFAVLLAIWYGNRLRNAHKKRHEQAQANEMFGHVLSHPVNIRFPDKLHMNPV